MLLVFYFLKLVPHVLTISYNGKVVSPEIVLGTLQPQSGICQQTVSCSTECERKGTFKTFLLHVAQAVIKGSVDVPEITHLGTWERQGARQQLLVTTDCHPPAFIPKLKSNTFGNRFKKIYS